MPVYKPRCPSLPKCQCLFADWHWRLPALLCGRGFPSFSSCLCRHGPSPSMLPSPSSSGSQGTAGNADTSGPWGVGGSWCGGWWLHRGRRFRVSGRESTVADSSWRWSPAGVGLPQSFLHEQIETRGEMILLHQQIFRGIMIPPQKTPVSRLWQVQQDHPPFLCILKAFSCRCNAGVLQLKGYYFHMHSAKPPVFINLSPAEITRGISGYIANIDSPSSGSDYLPPPEHMPSE